MALRSMQGQFLPPGLGFCRHVHPDGVCDYPFFFLAQRYIVSASRRVSVK
jgi:hypothetical protein